jgi:hypothetical protein
VFRDLETELALPDGCSQTIDGLAEGNAAREELDVEESESNAQNINIITSTFGRTDWDSSSPRARKAQKAGIRNNMKISPLVLEAKNANFRNKYSYVTCHTKQRVDRAIV